MGKKINTLLFIVIATILNIVLMIALFIGCLFLVTRFVNPESTMMPLIFGLIFLVSIGGSFVVYNLLIRWFSKKYSLEKYLSPLFSRKRKEP
ncbi:MAG: leader peptide processing enzyme [Sphaerochaetaceae bacterium]